MVFKTQPPPVSRLTQGLQNESPQAVAQRYLAQQAQGYYGLMAALQSQQSTPCLVEKKDLCRCSRVKLVIHEKCDVCIRNLRSWGVPMNDDGTHGRWR
jgi:hypothetical protein